MRIAEPPPEGITVQDLASEIARVAAERHADQWTKPGRDNGLRRDIAAAMNVHGWPPDGIPGVVQHIRNMVEMGVHGFGQIEVRSRFNGLPPTDPDEIKANPANWLIASEHAEIVRRALAVEAVRPEPAPDGYVLAAYKVEFGQQDSEKWTREQWTKVAAEVAVQPDTLLTIGDAANLVGHKFGWHDEAIKTLSKQMMAAVTAKALTVRHPHTDLPYEPKRVSRYYELVRTDDLDAWFESQKSPLRIQATPNAKGTRERKIAVTVPEVATVAHGSADWKSQARAIADELDAADARAGAWSSNSDMAHRVAREAMNRGVVGPHGQLTGANILREALQGERWVRKRSPAGAEKTGKSGNPKARKSGIRQAPT